MVERKLQEDVTDYKKAFREQNLNTVRLREVIKSGSREQKLAAYEMLKDKKALGGEELFDAYRLYGGAGSLSAAEFGLDIEFDKLSRDERKLWYEQSDNDDIRKKVAKVMAKEGEFKNANILYKAAQLYETETARKDFLKEALKKQIIPSLRAAKALGLLKDEDGNPIPIERAIRDEIKKRKGGDLLGLISSNLFVDLGPPPSDPTKRKAYVDQTKHLAQLRDAVKAALRESKIKEGLVKNRDITPEQLQIIETLVS